MLWTASYFVLHSMISYFYYLLFVRSYIPLSVWFVFVPGNVLHPSINNLVYFSVCFSVCLCVCFLVFLFVFMCAFVCVFYLLCVVCVCALNRRNSDDGREGWRRRHAGSAASPSQGNSPGLTYHCRTWLFSPHHVEQKHTYCHVNGFGTQTGGKKNRVLNFLLCDLHQPRLARPKLMYRMSFRLLSRILMGRQHTQQRTLHEHFLCADSLVPSCNSSGLPVVILVLLPYHTTSKDKTCVVSMRPRMLCGAVPPRRKQGKTAPASLCT